MAASGRTSRSEANERGSLRKGRARATVSGGSIEKVLHDRLRRVRSALKAVLAEPAAGRDVRGGQRVRAGGSRPATSGSARRQESDLPARVHKLRVACRRAAAAMTVFEDALPGKPAKRLRKRLRLLRKACGPQRDAHVLVEMLQARSAEAAKGDAAAYRRLLAIARRSDHAPDGFRGVNGATVLEELTELERRVLKKADPGVLGSDSKAGREIARARLGAAAARVARAAARLAAHGADGDSASEDERLHALRIEIKRLRYTASVLHAIRADDAVGALERELTGLQNALGAFNDQANLVAWIERATEEAGARGASWSRAVTRETQGLARARAHALERWREFERTAAWARLAVGASEGDRHDSSGREQQGAVGRAADGSDPRLVDVKLDRDGSVAGAGGSTVAVQNGVAVRRPRRSGTAKARLAAIDVGSNSIRLIVAESNGEGSYRVLDDEKEITRLGRGLHTLGRMDPQAIEHTAITIGRMASIAKGYGVEEIRVIATAAARDAANSSELIARVRERTGLEVRVISAVQEAEYAYRSAARAFDLSGVPAVVIDIGGGSTEIVLSVGSPDVAEGAVASGVGRGVGAVGGGVIERVFTVPVGAVRLAERFGGEPALSGERFDALRKYVRRLIKEHVGTPRVYPTVVIGTGGTLTTLAGMVSLRESGAAGSGAGTEGGASAGELGGAGGGLFDGSVQGQRVKRSDLRHMIDLVRKTPLKARARIPGLPADRADIILPGLVLADAVLERFECNTIRAHEGGIRDGVMLAMVGERTGGGGLETRDAASVMRSVRRFARACSYERAHSEHVAGLALSLFDQVRSAQVELFGASELLGDRDRLLLEAACVLHDVGYLINYARHHKHSYHLIVHAGISGLTTRERAIVANVARYHRSAEPKMSHPAFASLEERDRGVVRRLAGILRIADGLDRTHTQSVRAVRVALKSGQMLVLVESAQEPSVDVWGSHRKSELMAKVIGREVAYEWVRTGEERDVVSGRFERASEPANGAGARV